MLIFHSWDFKNAKTKTPRQMCIHIYLLFLTIIASELSWQANSHVYGPIKNPFSLPRLPSQPRITCILCLSRRLLDFKGDPVHKWCTRQVGCCWTKHIDSHSLLPTWTVILNTYRWENCPLCTTLFAYTGIKRKPWIIINFVYTDTSRYRKTFLLCSQSHHTQ